MIRILLTIMVSWAATTAAEEIYRWSNDDGSVTYSDQPPPPEAEGTRVKPETLPPLQVVPAINPATLPSPSQAESGTRDRAKTYQSFSIAEPKPGSAVRANDGDLAVTLELQPGLWIAAGHKIQLYLDGKTVAEGTQSTFQLSTLDRGAHNLRAEVLDPEGNSLISTDTISFTLLRHSRLF